MLTWLNYDLPFEPLLSYWLGGISVYDREDDLGEQLWAYDPNKKCDREQIIKKFILKRFDHLTYRHRFLLFSLLETALFSERYDFSKEFESSYDEHRSLAWDETQIEDPRGFFEDIYQLASDEWKEDLAKAVLEAPSDW